MAPLSFLAGFSTGGAWASLAEKAEYLSFVAGLNASQPVPVLVLGLAGDQDDLGFFCCHPSRTAPPLPEADAGEGEPDRGLPDHSPPVRALHLVIQSMASLAGSAAATITLAANDKK